MVKLAEGYLMIDHTFSPGTDKVPEGTKFEAKTMHCAHCGTVVIENPWRTRARDYCRKCDMYICDNCAIEVKLPDYVHKSYKQRIHEFYEQASRSLNTNG